MCVRYSTLLHLPPLRFHCVGGCWDRTQDGYDYTVLRPRIICLKYVHPGKRARAQKLYIFSSYTYAFDETFTCVWIILWCISLEWQEAHLDDGFTQTIPPRLLPDIQMIDMFFKPASHWPASRALIGHKSVILALN
jgi:hypothetical protein